MKEAMSRADNDLELTLGRFCLPHIARARGVRNIFFAHKQKATTAFAMIKPIIQPVDVQLSRMIVPVKKNISGDMKVASQTPCFNLIILPMAKPVTNLARAYVIKNTNDDIL